MLSEHRPSQGWTYRRNPDWYMAKELPYLDGVDYALITENSVSEAQFKAKRLWSFTPAAENVVTLKREVPDALLYQTSPKEGNAGYRLSNVSKIRGNPFMDDRVRHALSMLIDRDLQIEVFGNVSGFQKQGIEIETGWHSHIPLSWSSLWQDPKTGKMGEGSQWFQHNPDEAAKLLRAAGRFGMETDFASWTPATPDQVRQIEVVKGFLEQGGHFKLVPKISDFNAHHYPNYFLTQQFEGIANYQTVSGLPDFSMVMWQSTNPGTRTSKIETFDDYPGLKDLMLKARLEVDTNKKTELARDWARMLAKYMPFIPYAWPGGAGTFTFAWPWYGNYGVHRTYGTFTSQTDSLPRVWYDKSKDTRSA
jgi:ABC-type transport system substrate-binding protein